MGNQHPVDKPSPTCLIVSSRHPDTALSPSCLARELPVIEERSSHSPRMTQRSLSTLLPLWAIRLVCPPSSAISTVLARSHTRRRLWRQSLSLRHHRYEQRSPLGLCLWLTSF